jgi:hypothetical protein
MSICKLVIVTGLLGLFAGALAGCTPPQSGAGTTEWMVANQTLDTLWVAVRYPLDSAVVTATQLAECRSQLIADSVGLTRQNGFYQPSLRHLAYHKGQWFWVQNSVWGIVYRSDADPSPAQGPRINRVSGVLTYRIAPARTQLLLAADGGPDTQWPLPAITGLHLQQGAARLALVPGQPLLTVFRPQPTGEEHAYSPRYRVQLTVGPGLTINP